MQRRDERDGRGGARGISNVIGIVLLVALTILLVAVAGVYVTGFSGQIHEPAPPFASTTTVDDRWDPQGQYLNITHEGGTTLETDSLRLDVNGAAMVDGPPGGPRLDATLDGNVISDQVGATFTASETVVVDRDAFTASGATPGDDRIDLQDATVRIIYEHDGGDRTSTIYECQVASPDCEQTPD